MSLEVGMSVFIFIFLVLAMPGSHPAWLMLSTLIWLTFVKQVVCLRSEIFHILSVYYTANYSESETGTP